MQNSSASSTPPRQNHTFTEAWHQQPFETAQLARRTERFSYASHSGQTTGMWSIYTLLNWSRIRRACDGQGHCKGCVSWDALHGVDRQIHCSCNDKLKAECGYPRKSGTAIVMNENLISFSMETGLRLLVSDRQSGGRDTRALAIILATSQPQAQPKYNPVKLDTSFPEWIL